MKRMLLLVLFVFSMGLAACGGNDEGAADAVQTVSLTAEDIAYSTDRLEVVAGRPVELTLANEGALDHDFSIQHIPLAGEPEAPMEGEEMDHEMSMAEEELDLHVSSHAGESATLTFIPSEPGEYEFFCTVPGHKDAGMNGTLVVTAP